MQKPRRSRFSALRTPKIEIPDFGERPEVTDPSPPDPSLSQTPLENLASSRQDDFSPPGPNSESAGEEPGPAAAPPPWLRILNSRRVRPESKRQGTLLALGCLAVGSLAGYLLAKHSDKAAGIDAASADPVNTVQWSASEQQTIDAAYTARYLHRFTEAERLFIALGRGHRNWPVTEIELGRTLLYEGKLIEARTAMNTATANRLTAADAYFDLGVVNMAQGNFREAETSFAAAAAYDPTRPDYYYLWGECLRDDGKLLQAMEKFHSALTRNSYETADGLYRLKLWLSALDADQANSDGTNTEIDADLAQPLPSMEALFAAAARDLKAGNFRNAAEHMARARERTDPAVFHVILNDPTFAQVHARPELAGLFRPVEQSVNPWADAPSVVPTDESGRQHAPMSQTSASPAKHQ